MTAVPRRQWSIEPLSGEHDREAFDCGHSSLNEYLKRYARQNERIGISRTFVAVQPGERGVEGYYSLSMGAVAPARMPESTRKKLPRYAVPVVHMGRLAVDGTQQGRGLGERLLMDAFERVTRVANEIGVHAVEVVAIDEPAKRFYLKYGFMPLPDDPLHLYIPVTTVRRLGLT